MRRQPIIPSGPDRGRDPRRGVVRRALAALVATCALAAPARAAATDVFGEIEAYCRAREQVGTIRIRFVQTTFGAAGEEDDASGILYYRQPDQLRWEYDQPDRSWTVLSGSSGWAVYPRSKQVQYFEPGSERTQDLRAVLGFGPCGPEFWRSFDVVVSRRDDGAAVISLTPRRPQLAGLFRWIRLTLDPDDHLPRAIVFHEVTGDDVRFEFEDVDPDVELSGSLFELTVPEGYRPVAGRP